MCQDYYDEVLIKLAILPPRLRMEQMEFILSLQIVIFSSSHATHHLHKKSAVIREKYEH